MIIILIKIVSEFSVMPIGKLTVYGSIILYHERKQMRSTLGQNRKKVFHNSNEATIQIKEKNLYIANLKCIICYDSKLKTMTTICS